MSQLKLVLGTLGLMAALAGIALQNRWLVWIAIALLGVSIVLRMVLNMRARHLDSSQDADPGAPDA